MDGRQMVFQQAGTAFHTASCRFAGILGHVATQKGCFIGEYHLITQVCQPGCGRQSANAATENQNALRRHCHLSDAD
jgi:hypothetical protein